MGLHGKYRRVVTHMQKWAAICLLLLAGVVDVSAQLSDRQLSDELRQRRADRAAHLDPYWDGFILKYEGNCDTGHLSQMQSNYKGYIKEYKGNCNSKF